MSIFIPFWFPQCRRIEKLSGNNREVANTEGYSDELGSNRDRDFFHPLAIRTDQPGHNLHRFSRGRKYFFFFSSLPVMKKFMLYIVGVYANQHSINKSDGYKNQFHLLLKFIN